MQGFEKLKVGVRMQDHGLTQPKDAGSVKRPDLGVRKNTCNKQYQQMARQVDQTGHERQLMWDLAGSTRANGENSMSYSLNS